MGIGGLSGSQFEGNCNQGRGSSVAVSPHPWIVGTAPGQGEVLGILVY